MGALISISSPSKDNMRQKRSVTSADYDLKEFGLSEDLENWMKNLPPKLKATPIINLAIPGRPPVNRFWRYCPSSVQGMSSQIIQTPSLASTSRQFYCERHLTIIITVELLENWMKNLPPKLKATPIINLAIPGSHDSFTSGITTSSDLAPDAEDILKKLQWLGPIVKKFIVDWSRTQDMSASEQLKNGVRYFDLRFGTKFGTEDLFIVHGLYSNGVKEIFDNVGAFLEEHPQEIVILDCQHFYGFTQLDHENLIQMFNKYFGAKLLPYTNHMDYITLEYMTSQYRYQVIGIYRSDAARFGQPLLWPSDSFPTPWPNTMSKRKLFNALDIGIKNRGPNRAYISQCVLTPTVAYVLGHLFGSVRSKCGLQLEASRLRWIRNQQSGEKGPNIVIADYVDLSGWQFIKAVIDLNGKLLKNEDYSPSEEPNRVILVNQA